MRRSLARLLLAASILAVAGFSAHKAAKPLAKLFLDRTAAVGNVRIHHHPRDAAKAELVSKSFAADLGRIHADLGYAGNATADVWLTTSPYVYNLLCGNPLPLRPGGMRASDGGASPDGILMLIPPTWRPGINAGGLRDEATYILAHEYTHFVLYNVNPAAIRIDWLNEGLARKEGSGAYGEGLRAIDRSELQSDISAGRIPRLEQLRGGKLDEFVRLHGYLYGHSLVRYIEGAYGPDGLRRVVRSGGDISAALGVDDGLFQDDWNRFLRHEYVD